MIDFGDACAGDTARDFYCLLEESEEEIGRAFGLRVLREYGIADPSELLKKSDFHEFYWMIEETLYGFDYQDSEWIAGGLEAIRCFASRSLS